MKRVLLVGAAIAALSLSACATGTQDTSKWPSPTAVQVTVTTAEAVYVAYCASQEHAKICEGHQQDVTDAETAVQAGVATYTEAYNTGNITQATLDNLNADIAAFMKVLADIQSGN